MCRKVLWGFVVVAILVFVLGAELQGYPGQSENGRQAASVKELRRAVADSTDDAQQAVNGGSVYASALYMELMLNWFQKRWGGAVRFPDVTIPQGAQINSAHISVVSYSTCWLHAYDSIACEAVDSASGFTTAQGSYDLSSRWANRTDAVIVWDEDMRNSSIHPDSTPDLTNLLQEIVDRPNWKSGNSVVFIFKNIRDETDSSMFEFRTWEDTGWEESLFVSYTPPSAVDDDDYSQLGPVGFSLGQSYPNPFNLKAKIAYSLPKACQVKLTVFDLLGRRVKTLVDQYQMPGSKAVDWDATDENGDVVASGIYFYQLEAEPFTETKKLLLIK
jgi:hypothetical protein